MTDSALAAIIVGGGRSRRMSGRDKLYAPLGGRPVIAATVEAFEAAAAVSAIVLVAAPERVAYCRELAQEGDSAANGLRALQGTPAAYVAVHDAARPFVTPELIARGLAAARRHGAAVPGIACADTIKRVDGNERALETLPRDSLRAVQTPQVFDRALLERAYAAHEPNAAAFTDDAAVVEAAGVCVHVFAGDYGNMKITTPTDLAFAQWRAQRSDGDA